MARYTPLFYRGAPASIPQVVAHLQKAMSEEDPDYTPLRQRMPPASIPDIVAHIQKYLTENAFVTMEDLGDDIAQYIEDHPEIVGVFTVNGSSGNVVLDAGNIPLETGEDPTIAGAISYLSSQLALLVADAVLSVNGLTPDDSHNVTLTGANIAQDGTTTKKLSETFGPASASAAGSKGLVPAPQIGDQDKVLSGSGAWVDQSTGAVQTVCNVGPNAQGNIPLMGSNIPLQSMSLQTVAQAIAAVDGKTGSDINTSSTDPTPISTSLSNLNDQIGDVALPTTAQTLTGAIAEDHGQINSIINSLNGFKIQYGGRNPSDWNNSFSSAKTITFYEIFGSLGSGAPTGAYGYGLLIAISYTSNNWTNALIYIPDLYDNYNKIYMKIKGRTTWLELSGTNINSIS